MERGEIYQALEDDFSETFIRELMPGILHNFANPLNGIMGRARLLQKRMEDLLQKIDLSYPETAGALENELKRIRNDIASINRESDSFYDIFRDASAKFYALAHRGVDEMNINQVVSAEMRFADFYLEFKHEIVKEIELGEYIPDIKGNSAELSLVFWRLIRMAMTRALKSEKKVFYLKTKHDHSNIIVLISYSGDAVSAEDESSVRRFFSDASSDLNDVKMEKGVSWALMILKKYLAHVQFSDKDGLNTITVIIPHAFSDGEKK
ncbi:MAG TPA: hypothetical protein PKN70_05185 [Smithellaceae bacterium]|jgi:hypothetical protein|nr:hypothetical protein [Smithellaceae bacterium]HQM45052.1 hypothetical protein [Smithellaceae bacterium]